MVETDSCHNSLKTRLDQTLRVSDTVSDPSCLEISSKSPLCSCHVQNCSDISCRKSEERPVLHAKLQELVEFRGKFPALHVYQAAQVQPMAQVWIENWAVPPIQIMEITLISLMHFWHPKQIISWKLWWQSMGLHLDPLFDTLGLPRWIFVQLRPWHDQWQFIGDGLREQQRGELLRHPAEPAKKLDCPSSCCNILAKAITAN